MPRVLIISEAWPAADERLLLAEAVTDAGFEVDIITDARSAAAAQVIRLPWEPPRSGGALFGLRNALFFGAAANAGNYAQLRDRLHTHLQDVLYDAVIILCPPQVYLRLGGWIGETFGIPVWIHLTHALTDAGPAGPARWYRRRQRRNYLTSAKLITAASEAWLSAGTAPDDQLRFVLEGRDALHFRDPETGAVAGVKRLLDRIARRKG